jgi:polyphosphate glucokinase
MTNPGEHPTTVPNRPFTLAIDIGGTGLKASVLDASGVMVADRVRVATTYPCPPGKLLDDLVALIAPLPAADRISAGFPGMVREGLVLTAPHFVLENGPGSSVDKSLLAAWSNFDLAVALATRLGHPTKVANDADLQGAAVVAGHGLELVLTLGTGFGTALFFNGHLLPHLELAHHPFRKGDTYNEQIGDQARKAVGDERWAKRVKLAVSVLRALTFFDRCYIGGGNARRVEHLAGEDIEIVDNTAGILGGIKLWGKSHVAL